MEQPEDSQSRTLKEPLLHLSTEPEHSTGVQSIVGIPGEALVKFKPSPSPFGDDGYEHDHPLRLGLGTRLGRVKKARRWLHDFANPDDPHFSLHTHRFHYAAHGFQYLMLSVIMVNLLVLIPPCARFIHRHISIAHLSAVTFVFFVADYLIRLWVAVEDRKEGTGHVICRLRWAFCNCFNLMDLFAILLFALALVVEIWPGAVSSLRLCRLGRAITKIGRVVRTVGAMVALQGNIWGDAQATADHELEHAIAKHDDNEEKGMHHAYVGMRKILYDFVHPHDVKNHSCTYSQVFHDIAVGFQIFIVVLIFVNLIFVGVDLLEIQCLEAISQKVQNSLAYVTVLVFGTEYLMRLWVCVEDDENKGKNRCMARIAFFLKPMNLLDIVSIGTIFATMAKGGGKGGAKGKGKGKGPGAGAGGKAGGGRGAAAAGGGRGAGGGAGAGKGAGGGAAGLRGGGGGGVAGGGAGASGKSGGGGGSTMGSALRVARGARMLQVANQAKTIRAAQSVLKMGQMTRMANNAMQKLAESDELNDGTFVDSPSSKGKGKGKNGKGKGPGIEEVNALKDEHKAKVKDVISDLGKLNERIVNSHSELQAEIDALHRSFQGKGPQPNAGTAA